MSQFSSLSDEQKDRVIGTLLNGGNDAARADPEKFMATRDEYVARSLVAHGVPPNEMDNPDARLADEDLTPAASPFNPHWLIGLQLMDPFNKRRLTRIFRPREIGRVTTSASANPSEFDGRTVKWQAFEGESIDGNSGIVMFRPRLAFIQGWGSAGNQLYGAVSVTHWRRKHGITWLAMRQIRPSSDPAVNPSGLGDILYEEMLRNVRWIPMAIGSWDGSGDYLVDPQSTMPDLESAFMVHINDNGRYERRIFTDSAIQSWQRQILQQRPSIAVTAESAQVDTSDPEMAERRYWQLVMAVHIAIASDVQFAELINMVPVGKTLSSERLPTGGTQAKYLPVYVTGNASMSRAERTLNTPRPFTF